MTEVYTIQACRSYEGCELYEVCSGQDTADAAARAIWTQDPGRRVQISAWTVDGARRGVFSGDFTDYTDPEDPEDGPQWDPAPGVTP
ncbi:hypothetical protein [Nocardia sp. NPDC004711]